MPDEVEVDCSDDRFGSTPFGRIGSPPHFVDGRLIGDDPPPVMLILASNVAQALAPGGDRTWGGVVSTATRDGIFRVDSLDGSWVWELFPARWSDDVDTPACYVGVWRD